MPQSQHKAALRNILIKTLTLQEKRFFFFKKKKKRNFKHETVWVQEDTFHQHLKLFIHINILHKVHVSRCAKKRI